jgi:hypothetical protein
MAQAILAISVFDTPWRPTGNSTAVSADELCDELLAHMLDCGECLNGCVDGTEKMCPIERKLQEQIKTLGGSKEPRVFGY